MKFHLRALLITVAYVIIAAIGPALMYVFREDYLNYLEASNAELVAVQGTLEEGEVGYSNNRRPHREVRVRYSYTYEGSEYTGTRLCYGASKGWSYSTDKLNDIFDEARDRGSVTLHVDRQNPSRSVLLPDRDGIITPMTIGVSLLGGLIFLAGLLGLASHVFRWIRGKST